MMLKGVLFAAWTVWCFLMGVAAAYHAPPSKVSVVMLGSVPIMVGSYPACPVIADELAASHMVCMPVEYDP